jgi:hypothetical protein
MMEQFDGYDAAVHLRHRETEPFVGYDAAVLRRHREAGLGLMERLAGLPTANAMDARLRPALDACYTAVVVHRDPFLLVTDFMAARQWVKAASARHDLAMLDDGRVVLERVARKTNQIVFTPRRVLDDTDPVFAAARIAALERRVAELEEQMVEVIHAPGMPRACDAGARFDAAAAAAAADPSTRAMDRTDSDATKPDPEPLGQRRALCPVDGQCVDEGVAV